MADKTHLIRRKQDGAVIGPLTQKELDGIAGYPEDFEKLDEVKPSKAGYGKAYEPAKGAETAAAPAKNEG